MINVKLPEIDMVVFEILRASALVLRAYTLLALGGRGPLCGTGVASLMLCTCAPLETKLRMADSRPEPTPFTTTEISRTPIVVALAATASPTLAAAKGVPFLAPLKPSMPLEEKATTFPFSSVRVRRVLL